MTISYDLSFPCEAEVLLTLLFRARPRDCVAPFSDEGYGLKAPPFVAMSLENSSSYDLYLKPSGLCQNALFCAYQGCTPPKGGACAALQEDKVRELVATPEKLTALLHRCPPDNLPFSVVKVETVADIIQAVDFARHTGKPISVKVSGHNYAGSSSFYGSVNINLANYQKYSKSNVLECGTLPEPIPPSLTQQKAVCDLAAARGKKAVVRVGGGENWNELYSAVYWYQFPTETTRRYCTWWWAGRQEPFQLLGVGCRAGACRGPLACASLAMVWIRSCRSRWCFLMENMCGSCPAVGRMWLANPTRKLSLFLGNAIKTRWLMRASGSGSLVMILDSRWLSRICGLPCGEAVEGPLELWPLSTTNFMNRWVNSCRWTTTSFSPFLQSCPVAPQSLARTWWGHCGSTSSEIFSIQRTSFHEKRTANSVAVPASTWTFF